jgi:hypothetical protein
MVLGEFNSLFQLKIFIKINYHNNFNKIHSLEYIYVPIFVIPLIPLFAPLRQPAFFKNFKVEKGVYGIVWNEDIDLSEYELWKNGITVAKGECSGAL